MFERIALFLLTVTVGIAASGCTPQAATPSRNITGTPQATIYSPEGVFEMVWVQEPAATLKQAVGEPSKVEPAASKAAGENWIYATGDRAARVNLRGGVVFQVELIDTTGGQSKVLSTKNAAGDTGK